MEFEILGRPPAGPTLDLDHEWFAYAGKFVMSSTGKSVVRDEGTVIGAIAFSGDHADPGAVRLRYVTVREDRRGDGVGPRLLRFTAERLRADYERVHIAVNNPIAYQACYRAGFAFTGEETGVAELLLAYQSGSDRSAGAYRDGLRTFEGRDLPPAQQALLDRHLDAPPPSIVDVPGQEADRNR